MPPQTPRENPAAGYEHAISVVLRILGTLMLLVMVFVLATTMRGPPQLAEIPMPGARSDTPWLARASSPERSTAAEAAVKAIVGVGSDNTPAADDVASDGAPAPASPPALAPSSDLDGATSAMIGAGSGSTAALGGPPASPPALVPSFDLKTATSGTSGATTGSTSAIGGPSAEPQTKRTPRPPAPALADPSSVCPPSDSGWRCYSAVEEEIDGPHVAAAWTTQALLPTLGLVPDLSLHPSAEMLVVVDGLRAWLATQSGSCEEHLRLTLNAHALTDLLPTLCDEASGRVLFQLRNFTLEPVDKLRQPTAWQRILAARSNTFWTATEISVSWEEGDPLPSHVGWNAGASLWLVPPVNAWLAVGGILAVLSFLIDMHRRSGLLRERAGGRFSLSRTQAAWWFMVVFASWEILCAFRRDFAPIGQSSLALLGIAGGTYSWVRANTPDTAPGGRKGRQRASGGFWLDLVSDDNGPVLHRLQMVAWSIVIGVAYVYGTVVQLQLPEIDVTLLGLMGLSAGGYLVMKPNEIKASVADETARTEAPPPPEGPPQAPPA